MAGARLDSSRNVRADAAPLGRHGGGVRRVEAVEAGGGVRRVEVADADGGVRGCMSASVFTPTNADTTEADTRRHNSSSEGQEVERQESRGPGVAR